MYQGHYEERPCKTVGLRPENGRYGGGFYLLWPSEYVWYLCMNAWYKQQIITIRKQPIWNIWYFSFYLFSHYYSMNPSRYYLTPYYYSFPCLCIQIKIHTLVPLPKLALPTHQSIRQRACPYRPAGHPIFDAGIQYPNWRITSY